MGAGSSGGTSGGSGNGAVEVAGFVDAVSFSVEVPVCLEVAVVAARPLRKPPQIMVGLRVTRGLARELTI
jgi:hypothetical protein